MGFIWRAIHTLLYETPGGVSGWFGRTRYWMRDRQEYEEWEHDQRRNHEGSVP